MEGLTDRRVAVLLEAIAADTASILGDNLVGIYLHGSLAFGCFRWDVSDIDYLTVTRKPPTQPQKEALITAILSRDAELPPKGIEMSIVTEADCRAPHHPIPYTLHYSNTHRDRYRTDPAGTAAGMQGRDPDLAAHFTVTRAIGLALIGPAPQTLFAPIPQEAYLDSVMADIADAPDNILRDPVYTILNLSRTSAYLADQIIRSKAEGGEWGLAHLPDPAIPAAALAAYRGEAAFPALDQARLVEFARCVLSQIQQNQKELP